MRNTFLLMTLIIKIEFFRQDKGNTGRVLLLVLAIPFAFIVYNLFYALFKDLYRTLAHTGEETAILGLILLLSLTLCFVLSFVPSLNSFYLSESIEAYLPLPLKPYQIMLGKSSYPLAVLYLWNIIITMALLFMYIMQADVSIVFVLYAFLIWATLPIIPFLEVTVLLMILMRFINISKYKDRAKALGGTLSLLFILGINVLTRRDTPGSNEDRITPLLQGGGFLSSLTAYVPNAKLAATALSNPMSYEGLFALLAYLLMTAAAFFLFLFFSETLYFKGVQGLSGGNRSSSDPTLRKGKQRPVIRSLTARDFRTIIRTPSYFTQILVHQFFAPLFLIVLLFLDSGNPFAGLESMSDSTLLTVLLAFSILIGATSTAGTSAFSREGRTLAHFGSLPIDFHQLLKSKLTVAWVVPSVSLYSFAIAIWFLLPLPFGLWLAWVLLSSIVLLLTSMLGIALDLHEPKLNWAGEEEVFQHRFINLFLLLGSAILFTPVLLLLWQLPFTDNATGAVLFAFGSLLLYLLLGGKPFRNRTERYFERIKD